MVDEGNSRDELVRLTQLLVVEGAKVVGAFAAQQGLHPTDVEALSRVRVAEERGAAMTAGALARELSLTSGAITFLVDRLERAGHIRRLRDDQDRRKVRLHYSPDGRVLADEFFGPLQQHSDAVMDQFSAEDLDVVRRYLAATTAAMAAHRLSLTPRPADRPSRGEQGDGARGPG